jgi:hypothetical protein
MDSLGSVLCQNDYCSIKLGHYCELMLRDLDQAHGKSFSPVLELDSDSD